MQVVITIGAVLGLAMVASANPQQSGQPFQNYLGQLLNNVGKGNPYYGNQGQQGQLPFGNFQGFPTQGFGQGGFPGQGAFPGQGFQGLPRQLAQQPPQGYHNAKPFQPPQGYQHPQGYPPQGFPYGFWPSPQPTESTAEPSSTTTTEPAPTQPPLPVSCMMSSSLANMPMFPCMGEKKEGYAYNMMSKTCEKREFCSWGNFGGMQGFATAEECDVTCVNTTTPAPATTAMPNTGVPAGTQAP